MKLSSTVGLILLLFLASVPARGQSAAPELPGMSGGEVPASATSVGMQGAFLGGVPTGKLQPGTIPLSLTEAVQRGLRYNLGLLIAGDQTRSARGARWKALADLLPHVTTGVS
jgi:outer membrane protein TolC